jgi:ABC-type branched-subunit amino acid transport system substrate-binding protein
MLLLLCLLPILWVLSCSAAFVKAAENNDLGLKIFSGDALADPMMVTLLKDQPSALKDLSVTTVNKGKNPFIRRFRDMFPNVTYGSFAAQGYDAMVALLKAYAAAAPSRDGQDLADQLQRQQFEGKRLSGSCL